MSCDPTWKLQSLQALLEQRLRDEQQKPQPNPFTLQALRRRRVQVQDALARAG